jgi:hypothetical protein
MNLRKKIKSCETNFGRRAVFVLTCVCDVEKERHRHYYMRKDQHVASAIEDGGNECGAPSVRLSATKKSAKGGIPKRAFRVAKAAERKTKGDRILKS